MKFNFFLFDIVEAMEDIIKATDLLHDLKAKAVDLSGHVSSMIQKVENEEISTSKVCGQYVCVVIYLCCSKLAFM